MKKKIDLTHLEDAIFYKHIYPVYPKEFLFSNEYEWFADKVSESFLLNERQWQNILEEWELKETILA